MLLGVNKNTGNRVIANKGNADNISEFKTETSY
jgi:hypothetical protein